MTKTDLSFYTTDRDVARVAFVRDRVRLEATWGWGLRITVTVNARHRWRWLRAEVGALRGQKRVQTVAISTWLTDESMRGNLRRKSFIRFKVGLGGEFEPGERGCQWQDSHGRPCTWERDHVPMVVGFRNTRTGEIHGRSVRSHSWAVSRLPKNAVVLVEPRRQNGRVPNPTQPKER